MQLRWLGSVHTLGHNGTLPTYGVPLRDMISWGHLDHSVLGFSCWKILASGGLLLDSIHHARYAFSILQIQTLILNLKMLTCISFHFN